MAFQTGRRRPNRNARNNQGRRNHASDAGISFRAGPNAADRAGGDSRAPSSSDSDSSSSDSDGESTRLSGLVSSFRVVTESLLRMEQTELEMAKEREALRLSAEKRRAELETELTQTLMQTQLQIASLVSRQNPSRKRKRAEEDESSSISQREGGLMSSLLQCNLLF